MAALLSSVLLNCVTYWQLNVSMILASIPIKFCNSREAESIPLQIYLRPGMCFLRLQRDQMEQHAETVSYHRQWNNSNKILLADEDFRQGYVCCPLPRVFHLPGDGLRSRQAAKTGYFKVHLHNLIE